MGMWEGSRPDNFTASSRSPDGGASGNRRTSTNPTILPSMHHTRPLVFACLTAACILSPGLRAQASAPANPVQAPAESLEPKKDETVVLSPFTVTTTQDKGYRATNT